ncbi:uncharacterized protein LOC110894733 isoform X1 [Helianthus annuus]|uniref:uncharacterized protein LOC110894733 isoform X1 n=2 Tax=Helianthus annuus TaxID=4232 RepID=UPI001653237A|nr:uncharacterized protein LOC110894733 isoform X1 [Helianthus annuus]
MLVVVFYFVILNCRGPEAIQNPLNLRKNASTAANMTELASSYTPVNPAPLRRTSSWSFDEKLFVQNLYKAALDVVTVEPPLKDSKLVNHENVTVTPHPGASTTEAQLRWKETANYADKT